MISMASMILVSILMCSVLFAATNNIERKWQIKDKSLRLSDKAGRSIKSIDLYEKKEKEPFKSRTTGKTVQINVDRVSRAYTSLNGSYVAHVIQERRDFGYEYSESTTSLRYLDSGGNAIWERRSIDLDRGIHLSDSGEYVLLVQSSKDGCSSELESDCTKTLIVVNHTGQVLLEMGPYNFIGDTILTKNGKYGMATVDGAAIFFNVERKKIISRQLSDFSSKGMPRILENGIVQVVKQEYEDNTHRKLKQEQIVESFEIK